MSPVLHIQSRRNKFGDNSFYEVKTAHKVKFRKKGEKGWDA